MSRKNPFKGSKEVKNKKNDYNKIIKESKKISLILQQKVKDLQSLAENISSDDFSIEKLPITNLHDSYNLENGKYRTPVLAALKIKKEIINSITENKNKLNKFTQDLQIAEIDIVLAKIKHLQASLGEEEIKKDKLNEESTSTE